MLTQLIKQQIDTNPAVRKHLVSAILLGGNITVPVGKAVGGSFQHVPACTKQQPDRLRGGLLELPRPAAEQQPVRADRLAGDQVLCTNPADL